MDVERARDLLDAARAAVDGSLGSSAARLNAVAATVAEALEVERCWICRREGAVLRTLAGVGMVMAAPHHAPLPIDKGIVGRCARQGRCMRVDDVLTDPDYFAATALTRSELAVPVLLGGDVVGVLNAEANRAAAFSDDEQQLLERVAALLAPLLGRL